MLTKPLLGRYHTREISPLSALDLHWRLRGLRVLKSSVQEAMQAHRQASHDLQRSSRGSQQQLSYQRDPPPHLQTHRELVRFKGGAHRVTSPLTVRALLFWGHWVHVPASVQIAVTHRCHHPPSPRGLPAAGSHPQPVERRGKSEAHGSHSCLQTGGWGMGVGGGETDV